MKALILTFLLFSTTCFAQQNDNKGTVKVKKQPVVKKVDSAITIIDTTKQYMYGMIVNVGTLPSSYGQVYESPPKYVGGDTAQKHFVYTTMIYPECSRCKGNSGFTELTFFVGEDGSISDVSVKKGFPDCTKCDEEAVRIVKLMPKWTPAQLDGKNIKIKWDFGIRFIYGK